MPENGAQRLSCERNGGKCQSFARVCRERAPSGRFPEEPSASAGLARSSREMASQASSVHEKRSRPLPGMLLTPDFWPLSGQRAEKARLCARLSRERSPIAGLGGVRAPERVLWRAFDYLCPGLCGGLVGQHPRPQLLQRHVLPGWLKNQRSLADYLCRI